MAAALAAAASDWIPVGISRSSLRIFVQRSSIRQASALRMARVRIGSAKAFVGSIDLVYQDKEIDCSARTWRMLGYEARDAADKIVKRSDRAAARSPALPVSQDSIADRVIGTVCAFAIAR